MKGYDVPSREIAAPRLMAYRTVQTCIDTIDGRLGVGGTCSLWSSRDGSPFTKTEADDLEAVANGVEHRTTIERLTVDRVGVKTEPLDW
jgi:hypothetical protein